MSERPADSTAVTQPTVFPGLGYPNDRLEASETPVGWQGLNQGEVRIVSRETSESK